MVLTSDGKIFPCNLLLWLQRCGVSRNVIGQSNKKIFNLQPQSSWVANERSYRVWVRLARFAH